VSSVGDILLMFPLFYCIKELYPLCRLSFSSTRQHLLLVKYVDFIAPVEEKKLAFTRPDFGYNFNLVVERAERQGWGQGYHRSEIYARILGIDLKDYNFTLPYSGCEKAMVSALLQRKGYKTGPLIGFQLKGASAQRSFPADKVKKVIGMLAADGISVALLDGDRNAGWEGENIVNLCGKMNVLELAALIDKCTLVVSTDSGVTHIAGAVGKRNVAFFGCIPAKNRVKYPMCKVVDLARKHGCEPCWENGERCGRRWSCLAEVSEKFVYDRIMEQLQ
jgi:ADP-heptose:LPS heptosyltransferase